MLPHCRASGTSAPASNHTHSTQESFHTYIRDLDTASQKDGSSLFQSGSSKPASSRNASRSSTDLPRESKKGDPRGLVTDPIRDKKYVPDPGVDPRSKASLLRDAPRNQTNHPYGQYPSGLQNPAMASDTSLSRRASRKQPKDSSTPMVNQNPDFSRRASVKRSKGSSAAEATLTSRRTDVNGTGPSLSASHLPRSKPNSRKELGSSPPSSFPNSQTSLPPASVPDAPGPSGGSTGSNIDPSQGASAKQSKNVTVAEDTPARNSSTDLNKFAPSTSTPHLQRSKPNSKQELEPSLPSSFPANSHTSKPSASVTKSNIDLSVQKSSGAKATTVTNPSTDVYEAGPSTSTAHPKYPPSFPNQSHAPDSNVDPRPASPRRGASNPVVSRQAPTGRPEGSSPFEEAGCWKSWCSCWKHWCCR